MRRREVVDQGNSVVLYLFSILISGADEGKEWTYPENFRRIQHTPHTIDIRPQQEKLSNLLHDF